jgi:lysozyme family protein
MVFDAAVNQGIQRAKEMLQEALGVRVDGEIGPSTLGALALANPHILIAEYRDVRIQHYRRDAEFDKFGAGWVKRANQTAQEAATLV